MVTCTLVWLFWDERMDIIEYLNSELWELETVGHNAWKAQVSHFSGSSSSDCGFITWWWMVFYSVAEGFFVLLHGHYLKMCNILEPWWALGVFGWGVGGAWQVMLFWVYLLYVMVYSCLCTRVLALCILLEKMVESLEAWYLLWGCLDHGVMISSWFKWLELW